MNLIGIKKLRLEDQQLIAAVWESGTEYRQANELKYEENLETLIIQEI